MLNPASIGELLRKKKWGTEIFYEGIYNYKCYERFLRHEEKRRYREKKYEKTIFSLTPFLRTILAALVLNDYYYYLWSRNTYSPSSMVQMYQESKGITLESLLPKG